MHVSCVAANFIAFGIGLQHNSLNCDKRYQWGNELADNAQDIAVRLSRVRLLATLEEKVAPAHTAILVIDMQNDFCSPNGHIAKSGRDISASHRVAARLPGMLTRAREAGALVIFVRNIYSTEHNHYLSDVWLDHAAHKRDGGGTRTPFCAADSWGADFYGDVRPEPGDALVTKHRYSAFHNTDLETILRANGIRTIVLTGAVTNVCIETTAREGYVRDYYVVLAEDGSAAYSSEDQAAAIRNIGRYFGSVEPISALETIWKAACN
jgi:ureidoacrylate peracid hydrolase